MAKEINSDLLRGNINTIILKALYNGDRYGYDIVREIEIKSHGQYTIKQPTLYSCLKRLESQGFVSSYWGTQSNGGRRKYFSLTDLGKDVFRQSQDDYEYSRTIIDKLISEDKYDLGDYTPSLDDESEDTEEAIGAVAASESQIADTTEEFIASADPTNENLENITATTDAITPEETDEITAENNDLVEKIVDNTCSEQDIAEISTDSTENQEQSSESDFMEYIAVEGDTSNDYITDFTAENESSEADISSSIAVIEEDVSLHHDTAADLAALFNEESNNHTYISDIEDNKSDTEKSTYSDLFNSYASTENNIFGASDDNVASASYSTPKSSIYDLQYDDNNYPYSDIEGTAAKELESEFASFFNTPDTSNEQKSDDFISYSSNSFVEQEQNTTAEQSGLYQNKLGDLIENFYSQPSSDLTKESISNNALELKNKVQVRAFGNIVDSARNDLGEDVRVRVDNVDAKRQYPKLYYYRDSLMRLFGNAILFCLMLAESFIFYMIFRQGVGCSGPYDALIYVLSIFISLILPVYAVAKYWNDPHSKRRMENDFTHSIIFRSIVMVLLCLLSFSINLFIGMPLTGDITNYTVSLFLPIILSTNLPISALVFKILYKSPYFMVKD